MFGFLNKLKGTRPNLEELLANGAIVLDVRTKVEFQGGHVKGAINMPLQQLNVDKVKKYDKPVIACCASGMRSRSATARLKAAGIEAYNGGSWQQVQAMQQ